MENNLTPELKERFERMAGKYITGERYIPLYAIHELMLAAYELDRAIGWQLCPKCNGEGTVANRKPYVTTAPLMLTCPVCQGTKVLAITVPIPPSPNKD